MIIQEKSSNQVAIITIEGEVDLYNAKELKDILDDKMHKHQYEIVVNLEKVPFMDSSGIGTLVTAMYKLKKYHGNLKVCSVHGSVAKVFKLTGMESHLEVFDTEENAVLSLVKERESTE
ncbi:anti-sigma factor antagonist [Leptospira congkakensis]|uniref:Anti-sigma factor antagonist n=1 Tax=Leptospira congkakensis TaxID=2484932 RepID=A0A4Z1A0T6_9LEPT|nr:STAS domain-containing protein [Leptospira congkakensis]TGL85131.1 anti-sigma factor antagonist [Leptospira congkakensis]TGL92843.1 anti-sigma factor antagonist [Leptospira congkakensis]TGL95580.1 anti-sigma factor antagonist [Leptospira congkakensis]